MTILGFDPGRDKCGVAVMSQKRQLLNHQIVPAAEAIACVLSLSQQFGVKILVMGNQTTSKSWKSKLESELPPSISIVMVDERNSTLEARDRYWEMYPPRGLTRLIPPGMRIPPRVIDDLVAILLIERYLELRF